VVKASSTSTDEDREAGISWHLTRSAAQVPVKRMVFHEITQKAIDQALGETREVDATLVDAQEARRILDRLYGYECRPCCGRRWAEPAGRVQSWRRGWSSASGGAPATASKAPPGWLSGAIVSIDDARLGKRRRMAASASTASRR
jgi:hypothetical protein